MRRRRWPGLDLGRLTAPEDRAFLAARFGERLVCLTDAMLAVRNV